MPRYQAVASGDSPSIAHKTTRSVVASVMLAVCILSFVVQTELAQYVQRTTDYQKPYFLLYISHSCYVFLLPLQFIAECITRAYTTRPSSVWFLIKTTYADGWAQVTASLLQLQPSLRFLFSTALSLSLLLTLPAYLWYVSVNLTSMSNLTAIYNTGCFFAYVFSIWLLHDTLVAAKMGAILLCLLGVLCMALWHPEDSPANNSLVGIAVAVVSAASYGFYEVYYKKYASPSVPSILFANTITGIIGLVTFFVLWLPLPVLHVLGYELFELPDVQTALSIFAIASMSVIYNATFMCVIALVNPVFAAVGLMLTIPVVALTDVLVTGVMVPVSTLVGGTLILVGFAILNHSTHYDK
ncbi:hypothetical protein BDF14DRAFT_1976007 [Spinellus fusiger]|nr:hypothetical protein BDF14DRAFT_1976007 [Spinellus fusiger]